MNDLRQSHGDHTWDIVIDYFRCPHCGNIIEDRQQYREGPDRFYKDLTCDRCSHAFVASKRKRKQFWFNKKD